MFRFANTTPLPLLLLGFALLIPSGCDSDADAMQIVATAQAGDNKPLRPDDSEERACLDRCESRDLTSDGLATCQLNCTATDENLHESAVPTLIERVHACSMSCDAYGLTTQNEATCDELCVAREVDELNPCSHDCALDFISCEDSCDSQGQDSKICELGCSLGGETCVALCGPSAFRP